MLLDENALCGVTFQLMYGAWRHLRVVSKYQRPSVVMNINETC